MNVAILTELLPHLPRASAENGPDEAVRAALRPLIERAISGQCPAPIESDPARCPNCGTPARSPKSPYCSPQCRETSALIRRIRKALGDRSIFDPEGQISLGENLWKLQGGGFPRRQSIVEPKVMARIIARDGGRCSVCGAPATEIHHTDAALLRGSG